MLLKIHNVRIFSMLRQEKQYMRMLFANVISRFGDSLDAIAYSWMVYELTGSKAWLSLVFGVNALPSILLMPLVGPLSEFLSKKRVIVFCDLARGIIVSLTGLLLMLKLLRPWHILALTFLNSCFEALRIPCGLATIPLILGKENYKSALSFNQGACRIAELVGLGSAGAIVAILGSSGALFIDGATFAISSLILFGLKLSKAKRGRATLNFTSYFDSLKIGFHYFKNNRAIILLTGICIMINLSLLPIDNLKVAYVSEYLKLDVFAMPVGGVAMTIGTILGAFLMPKISKHISDKVLLIGGGMLIGILYFAHVAIGFFTLPNIKYISYAVTAFSFGFVNSMISVAVSIFFMSCLPDDLIGRIAGIFNSLAMCAIPIGSFVLAALASSLSVFQIYTIFGIFTLIVFFVMGRLKGTCELN